jgi:ChpA-C
MNLTLSRLLRAGVLAGGLIAVGAGAAHAGETTSGDHGLLSGNQVVVPVQVPITVNGNAIAVLGRAVATPTGHTTKPSTSPTGTTHSPSTHHSATTSGGHSVGSGNQVVAPIHAPILLGGNALAVLGHAAASPVASTGTGSSSAEPSTGTNQSTGTNGPTTTGNGSVGSGNQVVAPVSVPVTVGGNAIGVLGTGITPPGTTSTTPTTPTTPNSPATPTPADPTGPGTSTVLGEQLSASPAGLAGSAAAGTQSLAQTGGAPVLLAGAGVLLVLAGGIARWAGRCAPSGLKWGGTATSARQSSRLDT